MSSIQKVAIFGVVSSTTRTDLQLASGNFGTPITSALIHSGHFSTITIITRSESTSTFDNLLKTSTGPTNISVIKTAYTLENLTTALKDHDAATCVVGPAGVGDSQITMIDAAAAAGVKRFIVNDFGWGPHFRGLEEFATIHAQRRRAWDHAAAIAGEIPQFTWTGITTGNPIDWALKRFPMMGFDIHKYEATIYDAGTEQFTGTTLEGIGQAVVGVLQHPTETANRFVKVRSIKTCQRDLLEAFERATQGQDPDQGRKWRVRQASAKQLMESGKRKFQAGVGGWILELVVAQMFDEEGQGRCVVAASREESDADLLGVREESVEGVVAKVLNLA